MHAEVAFEMLFAIECRYVKMLQKMGLINLSEIQNTVEPALKDHHIGHNDVVVSRQAVFGGGQLH